MKVDYLLNILLPCFLLYPEGPQQ
jgi:hypothetical protein